jgi:hypothetical protein
VLAKNLNRFVCLAALSKVLAGDAYVHRQGKGRPEQEKARKTEPNQGRMSGIVRKITFQEAKYATGCASCRGALRIC